MAFNKRNKQNIQMNVLQNYKKHALCTKSALTYDIREIIRRRIQKAVVGRGFRCEVLNNDFANERMQEILEKGLYDDEIYNMVGDAFNGEVLATIDFADGRPILVPCEMSLLSQLGYQYNHRLSAVVWKKIVIDSKHFRIREHWTKDWVKRRVMYDNGKNVRIQDLVVKGFHIKEYEEHGLGILPVIRLTARKSGSRRCKADYTPVITLENLANDTLRIMYAELIKNQTRIFGNIKKADMDTLEKQYASTGGAMAGLLQDLLVKVDMGNDADSSPLIQVIQGDPKLTEYWNSIRQAMITYEQGIGLAVANKQDAGGSKTATEVSTENYETSELIQDKKHLVNRVLKEMVEIIVAYEKEHGYGDIYGDISNIVVEINSASIMGEMDRLEIQEREIELGVKSIPEVISERRSISIEQAGELATKILEERKLVMEALEPTEPNNGEGNAE